MLLSPSSPTPSLAPITRNSRANSKLSAVSSAFSLLMSALVQFIDERLAAAGPSLSDNDDSAAAKKREKMTVSLLSLSLSLWEQQGRRQLTNKRCEQMRDIRSYFKPDSSAAEQGQGGDDSMDPTTAAGKAHVLKQLLEVRPFCLIWATRHRRGRGLEEALTRSLSSLSLSLSLAQFFVTPSSPSSLSFISLTPLTPSLPLSPFSSHRPPSF